MNGAALHSSRAKGLWPVLSRLQLRSDLLLCAFTTARILNLLGLLSILGFKSLDLAPYLCLKSMGLAPYLFVIQVDGSLVDFMHRFVGFCADLALQVIGYFETFSDRASH